MQCHIIELSEQSLNRVFGFLPDHNKETEAFVAENSQSVDTLQKRTMTRSSSWDDPTASESDVSPRHTVDKGKKKHRSRHKGAIEPSPPQAGDVIKRSKMLLIMILNYYVVIF